MSLPIIQMLYYLTFCVNTHLSCYLPYLNFFKQNLKIPSFWKHSLIQLILMSGDFNNPSNYRIIYITCSLSIEMMFNNHFNTLKIIIFRQTTNMVSDRQSFISYHLFLVLKNVSLVNGIITLYL